MHARSSLIQCFRCLRAAGDNIGIQPPRKLTSFLRILGSHLSAPSHPRRILAPPYLQYLALPPAQRRRLLNVVSLSLAGTALDGAVQAPEVGMGGRGGGGAGWGCLSRAGGLDQAPEVDRRKLGDG